MRSRRLPAVLDAFGRRERSSALDWANPARYRCPARDWWDFADVRLRAISRLTVDGHRPSPRAMRAWLWPAARPSAMSSRYANDR